MKSKLFFLVALAVGMVFVLGGCKDCDDPSDPDCGNYDPCHDVKPANADFGIYSVFKTSSFYDEVLFKVEVDSVRRFESLLFEPKNKNDKYTWIIGSEVIEKEKIARGVFPTGSDISVTLIVEKNDNNCLNDYQKRDTLTKVFHCVREPRANLIYDTIYAKSDPFWGTYEGYNTDKPDEKFIISYGFFGRLKPPEGADIVYSLAGLPKGAPLQREFYQPEISWPLAAQVFDSYRFVVVRGYQGLLAALQFNNRGELVVEYDYNQTSLNNYLAGQRPVEIYPLKIRKRTFIGKKISNEVITQ